MKKQVEYDFNAISGGVNIIEIIPDNWGLNLTLEYEYDVALLPNSIHVPFENIYNKTLLIEAVRIIERVYHSNINDILIKLLKNE